MYFLDSHGGHDNLTLTLELMDTQNMTEGG